jgi:hypothetical protein
LALGIRQLIISPVRKQRTGAKTWYSPPLLHDDVWGIRMLRREPKKRRNVEKRKLKEKSVIDNGKCITQQIAKTHRQ